ncbi:putative transcriptional regulatory protein C56F2.05c [Acrodontium crateriforme]|uniref:Transcriptional regulatory protein C56F2.05c n=1 Tax=Acrodontium crateriforme TaxID=150365 RepID=A0AAQ3M2X5_9PEZI|nr:putative transcriptional regulatory protein C56F2.05c [Acrodontium crateriforme]
MDVSNMLSAGVHDSAEESDSRRLSHQYPMRHTNPHQDVDYRTGAYNGNGHRMSRASQPGSAAPGYPRHSPVKKDQKHVVFQLIDHSDPRIQARLPMRVMISQHDTIDSIVMTVKNFYGLWEYGVSFENKDGVSIIAAYENFENDMIVYVRTVLQVQPAMNDNARDTGSAKKPTLGAPFEMRPPHLNSNYSPSRSAARSAGIRSVSPHSETGMRSMSAALGGKPRIHRSKSKDNSLLGDADGYSSGDNDAGSVTSSRRSKQEQVNAEISVDNIVEGGRRKRAFESSELPLFVPPQVPISTSISSISPQRRNGPGNAASPNVYSHQRTFSYPQQPLPSPQSYGSASNANYTGLGNGFNGTYKQPYRQLRGGRPSHSSSRASNGGILPTPDPTVGSVISDEDVAMQLMRLGDPTAFSHGRTSTSTVDDTMSGKAEAASSDEEDEEEDVEENIPPAVPRFTDHDTGPQRKKQRVVNELPSDITSGDEYEDHRDGTFSATVEQDGERRHSKSKGVKQTSKPRANSMAKPKHKATGQSNAPMSPVSQSVASRKASVASTINFHHQLGADEEDLSSKPRCQRCRKSKKGCDRQRPCGRCKDAGIGIEGCVSEDEGNGRKGRYGRHMGVPVKKGEGSVDGDSVVSQAQSHAPSGHYFLAPALPDKNNKKRKR